MDQFGSYITDEQGERILACPVLQSKGQSKPRSVKRAEEAFPPLPGAKAVASDWMPVLAMTADGIKTAEKDAKARKWQEWVEKKEKDRQIWRENHRFRMEYKYGPRWFLMVKHTAEDDDSARELRELEEAASFVREEEAEQRNDAVWESVHAAWDEEDDNAHKVREERWATLPVGQANNERDEYMNDLCDQITSDGIRNQCH